MNAYWALGLLGIFSLLQGCQSTGAGSQKNPSEVAQWNNRIGSYTYSQALAELGSPNSQKKLPNGLTEYVWKENEFYDSSKLGPQTSTVDRFGQTKPNTQSGVIGFESRRLSLFFDQEGKLRSWQKK
jgi:hypothetical protein